MGRLAGKVALITGAARGQGRSHAVRLATEGADVVAFDVGDGYDWLAYPTASADDLAETVQQVEAFDRRILARHGDVRDRSALEKAVVDGIAEFGHIDIVSANAGICPPAAKFWEIPPERWRDVIDTNLTGVLNTVAAVAPHMIAAERGGSIILTSSGAGLSACPPFADYGVAKMGVISLVKTMAVELAPHLIRVNAVCPTTVSTAMVHNDGMYKLLRPDLERPTQQDAEVSCLAFNLLPVPWIDAADVSNAVLFLASDEARYITGTALPVDAGCLTK